MDFIEGLPKSNKFNVFAIVYQLSKLARFLPLKHPSAKSVTAVFNEEIMRLHGTLRSIVSD